MEFSRFEYWSRQPFPSLGDLPNPGIKPRSPALQVDSLPAEPQGKTKNPGVGSLSLLQGIFPIQGSNPGLPHCRRVLYQLSHQGSLKLSSLTCTLGRSREPSGPQFPLWYRGAHLGPPTLRLRVNVTSPALPAVRATELPSVHPDSQSRQPARPEPASITPPSGSSLVLPASSCVMWALIDGTPCEAEATGLRGQGCDYISEV